jgi:hypothetical protein
MFRKLTETIKAACLNNAARNGRLRCPGCGAKFTSVPTDWSQTITCNKCGTTASPIEWTASSNSGGLQAHPDEPPAATKITRETDASGTIAWKIPASGKFGGLLFFAIMWLSITAVVSGGFLAAYLSGAKTDDGNTLEGWWLIPFFSLFWAVGLGMLYAALRHRFARHRVSVDPHSINLRREFFGKITDKSLPIEGLKSIAQVEFYQQNYQPVFGIEIRGARGKLRFGSILSTEEKSWLVADLKRAVFGAPQPATPAAARPAYQAGSVLSNFSIVIPHSAKHLWGFAITLTLMGVGFVAVGVIFLGKDHFGSSVDEPIFFKMMSNLFGVLDRLFQVIWITFSSIMAVGGTFLTTTLMRKRGQESRIEGTSSQVAIRTYQHNLVIKERLFPRESVTDIRSSLSGSSNGRAMKRVELIAAGKAEKIASWMEAEKADDMIAEIRQALGFAN